jgi:hypothetical protein
VARANELDTDTELLQIWPKPEVVPSGAPLEVEHEFGLLTASLHQSTEQMLLVNLYSFLFFYKNM